MTYQSIKNKIERLKNIHNGFKNARERQEAIKMLQNIDSSIQPSDIRSTKDVKKLLDEYIPNYFNDEPFTAKNEMWLAHFG